MSEHLALDKATILDRLGGDEELFAEMAAMYIDDSEKYCLDLASAFQAGDAERVQREAHTIKGLLATFADDAGTVMAQNIEHQVRDHRQVDTLSAPIEALQARVRLLATTLALEIKPQ